MADYFWGEIEIGGPVPLRLVQGLLSAIGQVDRGRTGTPFTATDPATLLEQLDEDTGYLHLTNEQARYGQFEELEEFLQKHGIGYDRRSSGKHEFTPEEARFRPGMKGTVVRLMTHDELPVVDWLKVDEARQLLQAGKVEAASAKLRDVLGPDVPKLAPFEIV